MPIPSLILPCRFPKISVITSAVVALALGFSAPDPVRLDWDLPAALADDDDDDDEDNDSGGDGGGDSDGDDGGEDGNDDRDNDSDDEDDRDDGEEDDDDEDDDDEDDDDDDDDEEGEDSAGSGLGNGVVGTDQDGGSDDPREREVIAIDLDAETISQLQALGYQAQIFATNGLGLSIVRLRTPVGLDSETALAVVRSRQAVGSDVNHVYRLAASSTDVEVAQAQSCDDPACVAIRDLGWPDQEPLSCGVGQRVGLIDTTLDADTLGRQAGTPVVETFVPAGELLAESAHATQIASILVGRRGDPSTGLVPGASLLAAQVFYEDAQGRPQTDALSMVQALDWLVESGVDVINISIAGPANGILETAIERTVALGVDVVAAVGNAGPAQPALFPAGYEGVRAVTAVDGRGQPFRRAVRGDHVILAAPGVNVPIDLSRWSSSTEVTGTSYAAPFVTAAIAAFGDDETLIEAARDLGDPGRDPVFGWGLIQAGEVCR